MQIKDNVEMKMQLYQRASAASRMNDSSPFTHEANFKFSRLNEPKLLQRKINLNNSQRPTSIVPLALEDVIDGAVQAVQPAAAVLGDAFEILIY